METGTETSIEPVLLITGAARRIGATIAEYFHTQGYRVILHCNRSVAEAAALNDTLNERRANSAMVLEADLCNIAAVQQLATTAMSWQGHVNTLINNASSFYPTPMGQITEAQWDELLGSNLKGAFFLSQALAPTLRECRGSIINLTDMHADGGLKGHPVYSIAKAGVKMMTKALALELAPEVRVNGIAPGAILWPEKSSRANGSDENQRDEIRRDRILRSIALGRLGSAQDVAHTAWFLAHMDSYMSGQTIGVDGGRSADYSL